MILFKILFYVLYSFAYRTNKSITEWSTIITISILFTFNLITVLLFMNISIEKIGENGFKSIPVIFIVINWFYFIRKKSYLKIIENSPISNNKFLSNILVILYVLISIALFFKVLNIPIGYLIFTLVALTLVMSIAWIVGSSGQINSGKKS